MEIRTAESADAEAVAAVVVQAFSDEKHREAVRRSCEQAPQEWRVLVEDGRIVSACRVQVHVLRVGRCEIGKGDVGMVSTLPERQGRGFASELMRDVVRHLPQMGCQVGRLGGLIPFYARFGWEPFPRRYYEFPLEPAQAGAKTLQPDQYLAPAKDFRGRIRPFDPVRHHEGRVRVHEQFSRDRTGSLVLRWGDPPPRSEAKPDETGLRVVCEVEGEVVAYVLGFERPADHTAFEAQVELGETAYDFARPEAFGVVVAHVLGEAHRRGAERVTGRLPWDARVERDLRAAGVSFHQVELQTAPAGNMIRVVDLLGLLRRIARELETRLAASLAPEFAGEIALCLSDGRRAALEIKDGAISVWDWTPGDIRVELDQATLMKLVFGLRSFGECAEVQTEGDPRVAREVLTALFPRQATASGPWG